MTTVLRSTDSGSEWNCLELSVEKDGSTGSPITLYVTQDRADWEAKRLSSLLPGCRVRLETLARIKAVYRNGERESVMDYREFYSNLSDEEYRATKIQDSKTAEWI